MAKKQNYFDYSLLFCILFLMAFGLLMLYSASSSNAEVVFVDGAYFLKKQIKAMALGLIMMMIMIFIPYQWLKKFAFLIFLGSFSLCTLVLFIGKDYSGSKRWLDIGGRFQLQPSETAKIAIIIFLAAIITKISKNMGKFSSLLKISVMILPIIVVIAFQNLSTAIIVLGIAAVMLFVASPKYMQFILLGILGIGFIVFSG